MTFIQRLKALMKSRNITDKQLTEDLGLAKNSVTYWKNKGNIPKGDTLDVIAEYFGVSVDYLLGKTDKKNEQTVPDELSASEELRKLIEESSTLSDEEARKVREYVELLKLKRNQESS